MSSTQFQLGNAKTKISSSSSFLSKKVAPTTMEQVISLLKRQLRQCKIQRQQQRQSHRDQIAKYTKQIDSLRHKIIELKQKEYLKTILTEDTEQQRLKQASLSESHKKLKIYVQKLQADLKLKDQSIQALKQEKVDLNNEKQIILKEKEKHLELSIIEKINLEERIQVLERQIQSKSNLLNALKQHGEQSTGKEIQLKKLQRKLVKKLSQVQHYEEQLKNFKQFETKKLLTRIQTLSNENHFLKQHISKIQHQFNSNSQCLCSSNQCKMQIDMFKNKYINKSRQLSKVKVELCKEIFKEQFLRDIKNKQNIPSQSITKPRSRAESVKDKNTQKTMKRDEGILKTKQNRQKFDQKEDIYLFKFTENDQESSFNERTLPTESMSKHKSEMFKLKEARPIQYR